MKWLYTWFKEYKEEGDRKCGIVNMEIYGKKIYSYLANIFGNFVKQLNST